MSTVPESLATQHEDWTETGLAPAYRKVFCPRGVFLDLGQYRVDLGLKDPVRRHIICYIGGFGQMWEKLEEIAILSGRGPRIHCDSVVFAVR